MKKLNLNEQVNRIKTITKSINEQNYNRDHDFWSREKNAGLEDNGDYYEVENGEMVNASDYDEWEHGKIINKYNSDGTKITNNNEPENEPENEVNSEEKYKEDAKKITDGLMKAGAFEYSSPHFVDVYSRADDWGYTDVVKFIDKGVNDDLWSESSAYKYKGTIDSLYR